MNTYVNFQAARNQDSSARKKAGEYGRDTKIAVQGLTVKTAGLQSDLAELARDVQGVRWVAGQAVKKAEEGRVEEASGLRKETEAKLKKVEEEGKRIAKERGEVREGFVTLVLRE